MKTTTNEEQPDTLIVLADRMTKEVMDSVLEDWQEQGYENQVKRCPDGHVWLIGKRFL